MDVRNVTLKNFIYRGGDDCIAIKPRTFDVPISNITCEGGNGVAIGRLGQYLEDSTVDSVVVSVAKASLPIIAFVLSTPTLWLGR
jgi:hypothetical protein